MLIEHAMTLMSAHSSSCHKELIKPFFYKDMDWDHFIQYADYIVLRGTVCLTSDSCTIVQTFALFTKLLEIENPVYMFVCYAHGMLWHMVGKSILVQQGLLSDSD